MNILYYTYPWAFNVIGGGERQLLAYASHLERRGISATKFDMWNPRFGVHQIFHCFGVMPGSIPFLSVVKKELGLKLVVSPNLWITPETRHAYPYDELWNAFELSHAVVVNSNAEGDQMSRTFGMAREKFHTVYNGVDSDFLIDEDAQLFRSKFGIDGPYILNTANIEPRKNQLAFLKAMREAAPNHKLVIIGHIRDQNYYDECKRIAGESFLHVGMLPYASAMIRSAIKGCEFFAMPSLLETPSIAALEAAAAGARILITSVGSTTEYFGDTASYVNPLDHQSMSDGIAKVAKLAPLGSSKLVRERYMWTKITPSLEALYQRLVS